jgi:hypothetical protein
MATWWAVTRWRMAAETGWTLEYIDGLTMEDVREWLSIKDAEAKMSPNWKG